MVAIPFSGGPLLGAPVHSRPQDQEGVQKNGAWALLEVVEKKGKINFGGLWIAILKFAVDLAALGKGGLGGAG